MNAIDDNSPPHPQQLCHPNIQTLFFPAKNSIQLQRPGNFTDHLIQFNQL
jgi:hypothetical protein